MEIFGYQISKNIAPKSAQKEIISPIPKPDEDGSSTSTVFSGGLYGQNIDLGDSDTISDHDLIFKYRSISTQPEADTAIGDIVDGASAGYSGYSKKKTDTDTFLIIPSRSKILIHIQAT